MKVVRKINNPRKFINSLAFRLIASAAIWSGVGLLIGGLLLANVFRDTVVRNFDNSMIALWESLIATVELSESGALSVETDLYDQRFKPAFSGWYWQISSHANEPPVSADGRNSTDENIWTSRSLFDQKLAVTGLLSSTDYVREYADGPEGQNLRVIARLVSLPEARQPFEVIIAADKTQIDREIERFNTILAWAFGALGLGLLIAMLIQVRVGLSPLRSVSDALHRIRAGQAERLIGPFPLEIEPLTEELNALIDHNTEVLERARTQVGNLAHALKTPLSVLTTEGRSHSGELAKTIDKQTSVMREQVDHYLSRARAAAAARVIGARTPIAPVLDSLKRTLLKLHADQDLNIEINCSDAVNFRGEEQDLQEMVGNLLENACKWARSEIKVFVAMDESDEFGLVISIEDDGPGLNQDERHEVLKRGRRLDETMPGSGLGLSIVTEIVDFYRGSLMLDQSAMGGLKAQLRLPRSQ